MVFVEQPLALHRSAKKLVHYLLLPFYSLYLIDASVSLLPGTLAYKFSDLAQNVDIE